MRLSYTRDALGRLSPSEVHEAIRERRDAIRYHRDQRGDNRCWLDDQIVWQYLDDTPPFTMPTSSSGMTICHRFYHFRRADTADPLPDYAIIDPFFWDDDLIEASPNQLHTKLSLLQFAILAHRDYHVPLRTLEHDRILYTVLPEQLPADFRLPPKQEFLGLERAPHAGCPSFWNSHMDCPAPCRPHQWGPCTP